MPPKPKSMQADGQRKELQRITADNKRLYRSLQEIKPTVPSLKQIEHRVKDLDRWFKNGCSLPPVLHAPDSNNVSPRLSASAVENSPVKPATAASIQKAIKRAVRDNARAVNAPAPPPAHLPSPGLTPRERNMLQHAQFQDTPSSEAVALAVPTFPRKAERAGKDKGKKYAVLDSAAAAAAAAASASAEFEAARAMMSKLKAKALLELCQLKQSPQAVRQLLHAACAVMGEASHPLHHACLEVMSHASAQQRLAALQPADISSVSQAAFEEHMASYAPVEILGPSGRAGAKALHVFCTSLLKLLRVRRSIAKPHEQQQQQQQQQHQQQQQQQQQHELQDAEEHPQLAPEQTSAAPAASDTEMPQPPPAQVRAAEF